MVINKSGRKEIKEFVTMWHKFGEPTESALDSYVKDAEECDGSIEIPSRSTINGVPACFKVSKNGFAK